MTKRDLQALIRKAVKENPAAPAVILGELSEIARETATDLYKASRLKAGEAFERWGSFLEDSANKFLDEVLLG